MPKYNLQVLPFSTFTGQSNGDTRGEASEATGNYPLQNSLIYGYYVELLGSVATGNEVDEVLANLDEGSWQSLDIDLYNNTAPLQKRNGNKFYGASFSYGKKLSDHLGGIPVYIINCSRGGTTVNEHRPETQSYTPPGELNKILIEHYVKPGVQKLAAKGKLKSYVFYVDQGESDAIDFIRASNWDTYWAVDILATYQEAFPFLSNTPFVCRRTYATDPTYAGAPHYDTLRTRQATRDYIDTDDIPNPLKADGLHLNGPAQEIVGERLFEKVKNQ